MKVKGLRILDIAVGVIALFGLAVVGAAAMQQGRPETRAEPINARNRTDPNRDVWIHIVCASADIPFTDVRAIRVGEDGEPSGDVRESRPGSNVIRVPIYWQYRIELRKTDKRKKSAIGVNVLSFDPGTPPEITVKCRSSSGVLEFWYVSRTLNPHRSE